MITTTTAPPCLQIIFYAYSGQEQVQQNLYRKPEYTDNRGKYLLLPLANHRDDSFNCCSGYNVPTIFCSGYYVPTLFRNLQMYKCGRGPDFQNITSKPPS